MRVFRVVKNINYSVICNYHLKDKNLSLSAKGLLTVMLSLPNDWIFNINGLCKIANQKPAVIKRVLNELKNNHYLSVNKRNGARGRFIYEYVIYESNAINPNYNGENPPEHEKPPLVAPHMVNPDLYKDTNTNQDKIDKTKLNLCFITEFLIEREFIKLNDLDLFGYDEFFIKILNQHDVRDVYRAVTYTMSRMKLNNFKSENENEIINKLSYFISSVESNLRKLEASEDLYPEWNS